MPSLDLIAQSVHEELRGLTQHADAIDAKAGVLLGAAALLITFTGEKHGVWITVAHLSAFLSGAFALLCLVPKKSPKLRVKSLRDKYLTSEASITKLSILDSEVEMHGLAERAVVRKVFYLDAAAVSLLLAAGVAVVGAL